ncbi:hypothetical protein IT568_03985 [bacterium]|nr:hypothetical protein [bacterium]
MVLFRVNSNQTFKFKGLLKIFLGTVFLLVLSSSVFGQYSKILNSLPFSTQQKYASTIENCEISYTFPKFEIQTDSLTMNRILENLDLASLLWRVYGLKPKYDIIFLNKKGMFYLDDHRTIRGNIELTFNDRHKMGLWFSGKMNSSKPILKNMTVLGDGILLADFRYVRKNGKPYVEVECYAFAKIHNSFVSFLAGVFNSAIKTFAIKRMDTLINRSKIIFTSLYSDADYVSFKLEKSGEKTQSNFAKFRKVFFGES